MSTSRSCALLLFSLFVVAVLARGVLAAQKETFVLASPALRDGDKLARQFACDGGEHSVPLTFSGTPRQAKSLAVLMTETGAPKGNATLWILYNLPPSTTAVPENQPHARSIKGEALQLPAFNGKIGYAGPCPPGGLTRHFVIEAFALDTLLNLSEQAGRRDFLLAVEGHILARSRLAGKYKK